MPDSAELQEAKAVLDEIKKDPKIVFYDDWIDALDHLEPAERTALVAKFTEVAAKDTKYAEAYNGWGVALADQEKYAEATEQFAKAAQLDPKLPIDESKWAVSLAKQGRHLEAAPHFEEALKSDPEDATTQLEYAYTLIALRRKDEGIKHYGEATELDPYLAHEYLQRANEFEEAGKFEEADRIYEMAAQLDSLSADIYNEWGRVLERRQAKQKQKNYEPPIEKYREAIARDENFAFAPYNWGRLLLEQGKYSEAIEKFRHAVKADPKYANALLGWADALQKLGNFDEANAFFQKATEANPKSAVPFNAWGLALKGRQEKEKEKNYGPVIEKFQQAIKADPTFVYAYNNWGSLLLEQEDYKEAIEKFQQAIKADPTFTYAYFNWADALQKLGNFDEADDIYRKATQIDLNSANSYNEWGLALEQRQAKQKEKNYEPAIEKFQQAIEADPTFVYAYNNWGNLLLEQEKYEEAIEKFQQATRADSTHVNAFLNWAEALQKLGKFDEADAVFQKAIEANPKSAIPFNAWGLALKGRQEKEKEKNYGPAIEKFKAAIARDDKFVYAYNNWGNLLLEQKNYKEAIEKFRQAIKADPTFVYAFLNLADTLQKQENFEESDRIFQEATEVNPNLPDPYNRWGIALEDRQAKAKEKNYRPAIEKFRAAIARDEKYVYPYNNWGHLLLEQKRYTEAIEKFQQAIKAEPTFTEVYVNWATALSKLRGYEEANRQFEMALQMDAKSAYAHNGYANSLLDQRRYEEAIEHYQRAAEIEPNEATWHFNWGLTLMELHSYDKAFKRFQTAIEKQDTYIGAYLECGDAQQAKKLFAEAIPWYQKAAEREPENINCLLAWAGALLNLHRASEAHKKFEEAASKSREVETNMADVYYSWGITLCDLDYVEEGIRHYRKAVEQHPEHAYAYHNLAYYRERQGRYKESWAYWESAWRAYKNGLPNAKREHNSDFFYYFGCVLNKLGRVEAENTLLGGLELHPYHTGILAGLVDLYLEQKEELVLSDNKPDRERRALAQASARHYFRIAEELLLEEEKRNGPIVAPYFELAQLYLAMERYDKAKEYGQKALEQEGATAEEHNLMGVVQTRKEDYKGAIDSFLESLLLDPQNLTVRSNLAEAYLNAGLPDKAEEEYQKILNVTENHIEAQIGMGQVYLTKAEGKKEGSTESTEPDFFDDAVHYFARAVELGKNEPCSASSRMKPKKWAALYYSIGYTRVKMYSASRGIKDESLLRRALGDFKLCLKNDPEHYKARRAKKKIAEKLRPLSPERLMEKLGPAAIFLASTFVFAYTQFAFLHSGKISDPVLYSSLTFGSLVLMIAGLYLPRLLKLKVAGIELEKSTVDQITTSSTFEISKERVATIISSMVAYRPPSGLLGDLGMRQPKSSD